VSQGEELSPRSSESSPFARLLRRAAHVSEIPVEDKGAAERLRAGRKITPSLELVRELGAGGMGCVWLAHHAGLNADVAVKFIGAAGGERAAERFAREARMAARVRHPHVVQIFDHGTTDDGVPYIVMERLEGETLGERLARAGALAPHETALLVRQVAEALGAAHASGVVHRDIKPHNLFLVSSGHALFIKVLDFGLAKPVAAEAVAGVTRTGLCLGTPGYMSPEQLIDGRPANAASDSWALAVVAYECLTCELPFEGRTVAALGHALGDGALVPPTTRREELPRALDAWCARALARDPAARFSTPAELALGFERALEAQPSRPRRALVLGVLALAGGAWLAWPEGPARIQGHRGANAAWAERAPVAAPVAQPSRPESPAPAAPIVPSATVARKPRPVPSPAFAPATRPGYCNDPQGAFTEDGDGYVILKPECR
jgi:eukaryotic-like serine/threonine-protein kinase